MSALEHLKQTVSSFVIGKKEKLEDVTQIIRKDLAEMLINKDDFLALNDTFKLPTASGAEYKVQYRTAMWTILLALGEIPEKEVEQYLDSYHALTPNDKRNLVGEAQRISKSQKNQKVKTDFEALCSYLVLFSGYLNSQNSEHPLHQPLLSFGPVFLQHLSYPIAFFAFRQWAEYYAPHCFPRKKEFKAKSGTPSELAVKIAYEFDPSTEEKFSKWKPEVSFSYSHICSFFTQMKELDQVSILFDIMLAYGAFMVIFFEAAWMVENKDIKDIQSTMNMKDGSAIARKALIILKRTNPENVEKAKTFYKRQ